MSVNYLNGPVCSNVENKVLNSSATQVLAHYISSLLLPAGFEKF